MPQTRAWLFAFRKAFKTKYDPPPPTQDEFLSLLQLADERLGGEDEPHDEDGAPPPTAKPPLHH